MIPTTAAIVSTQAPMMPTAATHVALPLIFSDHMVLQRNAFVPIWGTADPNSGTVTVTIEGKSATASVDGTGKWRAVLPDLLAGGPYELTVNGANSLRLNDVLVGDVYLASGQSNMTYAMLNDRSNSVAAAAANDRNLRLFSVYASQAASPQSDVHSHSMWLAADDAATNKYWSAVSFYFGEELRQKTAVPIGMVESAIGETTGECWTAASVVDAHPDILASAKWQMNWAAGGGYPVPNFTPGACFNGMINPLIGYGIAGALWYQGEGNTWPQGHEKQYGKLLTLMARDWRSRWGYAFPFYVVQLPNYGTTSTDPSAWSGIAGVRAGQLAATKALPKSGLAVTIDLGDGEVHPPDKADVAHRLALLAERNIYHLSVDSMSPIAKSATVANGSVIVTFDDVFGSLAARNPLVHFALAGSDGIYHWANATIVGRTVVISAPSVPNPRSVRYAWQDNPQNIGLYDAAGLPAAPFDLSF